MTLGDFDGALRVIGARDPAGFELCGDTQATCHFVRAQLGEGGVVRLEDAAPEKATRVRFCWADAPLCNLYDTEGLPVGPFEIRRAVMGTFLDFLANGDRPGIVIGWCRRVLHTFESRLIARRSRRNCSWG